jgi:hypothetical protein
LHAGLEGFFVTGQFMNNRIIRSRGCRARLARFVVLVAAGFATPAIAADVSASWVGGAGDWSDPAHWSTNPAFPNNDDGVTYDAVVNPITYFDVTLTQPVTIEKLSLARVNLVGNSDLTLNDALSWTSGALSGPAKTTLNAGGTISGAEAKGINSHTLDNAGTLTWSGGLLLLNNATINNLASGTIDAQLDGIFGVSTPNVVNNAGTFKKSVGTGTVQVNATFNNTGNVQVTAGTLQLLAGGASSGAFTAAAGSTLELTRTHDLSATSQISGAGIIGIGIGDITNASGIVNFSGTYNVSGTTRVHGATLNFNAGANILSLGTLGTIDDIGSLNFSTGQDVAIAQPVTINLGGLGGTDKKTLTGLYTWDGGGRSEGAGRTIAAGGLQLGSGSFLLDGQTLENEAAATTTGNQTWDSVNGGKFINRASGTIDVYNSHIGGKFDNDGSIRVRTGTFYLGSTSPGAGGTHTGPITADAGTQVWIAGAQDFSATASLSAPAVAVQDGAVATFNGTFAAAGQLLVNASTVNFQPGAAVSFGSLKIESNGIVNFSTGAARTLGADFSLGGTLTGSDTILLAPDWYWTSGAMTGIGKTVVNTSLNIQPTTLVLSRKLENHGLINWYQGTITGGTGDGSIDNLAGATIQFKSNLLTVTGPFTINNAGSVLDDAGSFTDIIGGAFNNSGLVRVANGGIKFTGQFTQTAGTFELLNQTAEFTNPVQIQGGRLAASGTITGAVVNGGVLSVANDAEASPAGDTTGRLNTGALNLTSTSTLLIELGGKSGGSNYDLVVADGDIVLAGDLDVRFAEGFQLTISPTDGFTILRAAHSRASLTGAFDEIPDGGRISTSDGFGSFRIRYIANDITGPFVTLDQFQAVPEPASSLLAMLAVSLLAGRSRRR